MAEAGATCPASDAELIEASLDHAAAHGEDITGAVFDRFFAMAPAARDYFQLDELDPATHGRMLVEVLTLLLDGARGESYVAPTFRTQVADHVSYGVVGSALYERFVEGLQAVVADLAGAQWSAATQAAWQRQSAALIHAGFGSSFAA